jgi:hypothetical protein
MAGAFPVEYEGYAHFVEFTVRKLQFGGVGEIKRRTFVIR